MAVPTESFDIFIDRLLAVGCPGGRFTHQVSEDEITKLCSAAGAVFQAQPPLIEVEPPVVVCGDIHGQYSDLMRIFDKNELPPASNYLFLGDYIDRGRQNLETICLMFCFKVKYPFNFIMLRGNHECPAINRVYGFYEECNRRYKSMRLWQVFQDTFNWMPLVGLIGGRILCMHGGISPQIQNIDQLRQLHRPQDPPNPSIGIDLLWSDPDMWVKGWQANTRGVSYIFGQDCVIDMCAKLDIDLIARAHQVVQDGYEFFANKKLVTIFSDRVQMEVKKVLILLLVAVLHPQLYLALPTEVDWDEIGTPPYFVHEENPSIIYFKARNLRNHPRMIGFRWNTAVQTASYVWKKNGYLFDPTAIPDDRITQLDDEGEWKINMNL
ncbi:hypothetical protein WR25_24376 [Diploscapter pachys]|uniref:Serine/threonine-protein phosphatase n=1 Tax=Diploscapter pachys TaxID=2018661 RepID=A0A2A2LRZ5_9BILA|nr:hypothetical protein WR25_24376 [Diploscapter pachys]